MPSTSAKQAKFMRAVAHSPKFAKKVGVSQSVGKDFEMADKRKKMKKFSEGGEAARSAKINKRYDNKIADIKSDYEKALAKGKDAAVAKAKYEQRMADAADDRAKWTGGDRTQTRAAEKAAEKNLSMTRKYGPRSSDTQVAKAEEKLASKAPLSSVDTSELNKPKTTSFKDAFRAARKAGDKTFTWNGGSYTTQLAGQSATRPAARRTGTSTGTGRTATTTTTNAAPATTGRAATTNAASAKSDKKDYSGAAIFGRLKDRLGLSGTGKPSSANYGAYGDYIRKKDELEAKRAAEAEANAKAKVPVTRLSADPYGFYGKKKGGTVKKYNKGGMPKEQVTGGSSTVPMSPERKKFLDQMRKQNEEAQKQGKREGRAAPGHKAGGKIMKKSDKAGRALVKKSADTMGRAMKKYAAGGLASGHKSADGIAKKGHTKGMEPKMAKGGSCYAKGGSVDGCAVRGKTRAPMKKGR